MGPPRNGIRFQMDCNSCSFRGLFRAELPSHHKLQEAPAFENAGASVFLLLSYSFDADSHRL